MTDKQTAVHKRQKIQDSNKLMFIWVAGASVIVGFAVVICWFLWQKATHIMDIASAKEQTVGVLRANNDAVETLRKDILTLQTNSALLSSRTTTDENAVQVVLDALPADANPLALGASLQQRLLTEVPGLEVKSLKVDAINEEGGVDTVGQVSFSLSVSASNPNTLTQLLRRLERSIRVINIDTLQVNRSENNYSMSIKAHAYYQLEKELILEDRELE